MNFEKDTFELDCAIKNCLSLIAANEQKYFSKCIFVHLKKLQATKKAMKTESMFEIKLSSETSEFLLACWLRCWF